MSDPPSAVPGVLLADGITIQLESIVPIPPGKVLVTIAIPGAETSSGARTDAHMPPEELVTPDGVPTPLYAAYLRYQAEYASSKQDYESAYAETLTDPEKTRTWPLRGATLQDAVDAAMSKWVVLGHKNEVERLLSTAP